MPGSACASFPQKLHAIGIWQAKVQNERVIGSDREGRVRVFGAANCINDKAAFDEVIGDHLAHRGVVLNKEYLHAITVSGSARDQGYSGCLTTN